MGWSLRRSLVGWGYDKLSPVFRPSPHIVISNVPSLKKTFWIDIVLDTMRQQITAMPQSPILAKQGDIFLKTAINIAVYGSTGIITASHAACAWAMKFNRKYVGPIIHEPPNGGESASWSLGMDASVEFHINFMTFNFLP